MNAEKKVNAASVSYIEKNVFIVWKPEYDLGIPIIDEQHRGVVTIINTLYFAMKNDYIGAMLSPIIEMITSYTHIHFKVEEDFFIKSEFPQAKNHHNLHCELIDKLSSISRRSILDNDPHQFMDFLKTWWISHICNEDMLYRNYLLSLPKTE